jgi:hypothetical protein
MTTKNAGSLTDADIALLAAGGTSAKTEAEIAAEALALAEAEAKAKTEAEVKAKAELEAKAKLEAEKNPALVQLKEMLADANTKIAEAGLREKSLQEKVTGMEATHTGLLAIARGALSNMRVALGGTAVGVDAMDATAVLAAHATVSVEFQKKFKVGGVASTKAETTEQGAKAAAPLHQEFVAAARITSK